MDASSYVNFFLPAYEEIVAKFKETKKVNVRSCALIMCTGVRRTFLLNGRAKALDQKS